MSDETRTPAAERREAERAERDRQAAAAAEREAALATRRANAARQLRADVMTVANRAAATAGGLDWGEVAEALEGAAQAARALAGGRK
jgi:hypothetical protein